MNQVPKTFHPTVVWDSQVEAYLRGALGDEHFDRTAAALSRPPQTTCLRVNTLRTSPQEVATRVRQLLGPGSADDVVWVHPQVPCAVVLRGSGPHDVSYDAAGGREVVVSRRAGEAVLRGAPVYAPGVLAVSAGVSRGDLVAVAVGIEKPGSDTPEITRGTTLYDVTRGAAVTAASGTGTGTRPTAADGTAAAAVNQTAATSATPTIPRAAASLSSSSQATKGAVAAAMATAEALPQVAAADGANTAVHHNVQSAATKAVRIRARRRQRRGRGTGDPPTAADTADLPHDTDVRDANYAVHVGVPADACAAPRVGGASDGTPGLDSPSAAATAAETRPSPNSAANATATTVATSTVAAPAAVAATAAVAVPTGFTPSSQGPLPPRTGMYIGLARAAMSRQEMFRSREGLALEMVDPVYRVPPSVAGLPSGWVMLQNLPSVVAALVLAPVPSSRVLDMCAAPGGKATLLAQLMGNKGEVVAFDRTHAKVAEIASLARELGVTCIRPQKMDAGKALSRPAGHTAADRDARQGQGRGADEAAAAATATAAPAGAPATVAAADAAASETESGVEARVGDPQPAVAAGCEEGERCAAMAAALLKAVAVPALAGAAASDETMQLATEKEGGEAAAVALAPSARPLLSEKACLREERRRAAMIRRGITPPQPPEASHGTGPASYLPESFDALLLDAPCSALGLRPRLQQQASALYLRQCAAAQRRLVDCAVRLLRVGGSLVYSTCTINPGENEAIVRYLLDTYGSSFRLVPAGPPFLGGPGLVGRHPNMAAAGTPLVQHSGDGNGGGGRDAKQPLQVGAAPAEGTCRTRLTAANGSGAVTEESRAPAVGTGGEAWLSEAEAALVQRFDPAAPDLDCIGFFIAKFIKTAADQS